MRVLEDGNESQLGAGQQAPNGCHGDGRGCGLGVGMRWYCNGGKGQR